MMVRLALADVRFEWKMFACYAIAMAAVLAPLMVLYGLKFGVISALTAQLLSDPRNREILVVGNHAWSEEWLAELAARPEVGFLVPRTRSIAASLYFGPEVNPRTGVESAELVPTAPGDPLLDPALPPLADDQVALSHPLAEALGVEVGDEVGGFAVRRIGDRRERVDLAFRVARILPPASVQRKSAFVTLPVLEAVEDYRDGLAVRRYGWDGEAPPERARDYASFRIYARTLDDVAPLVDHLIALRVDVRSEMAEIEAVRRLDESLTTIFAIIAGVGGLGYLFSLAANLWSNVERKHRELSIIRLLGLSAAAMMRFPVFQAVAMSVAGLALAFGFYYGAERLINLLFTVPALENQLVCTLLPIHYGVAAAGTLACAVLASAVAGWRASRIEPAEGMRDV